MNTTKKTKAIDERIKELELRGKALSEKFRIIEERRIHNKAFRKEAYRQRLLCTLWVPYAYT